MAKEVKKLTAQQRDQQQSPAPQEVWQQDTTLGFTDRAGRKYRIVNFRTELTGLQDERLLSLLKHILPTVIGLQEDADKDSVEMLNAIGMLIDAALGEKAVLRELLAILFLPEDDRIFNQKDVPERMQIIGNLLSEDYQQLLACLPDFFVFARKSYHNVFAIFSLMR